MISSFFYLAVLLLFHASTAQAANKYRWYASTLKNADEGTSMILSPDPRKVVLSNGWSCEIGGVSENDDRNTSCKKNQEQIDFSVQCDLNRPKDHAQLRFRSGITRAFDFIEVGCEPRP